MKNAIKKAISVLLVAVMVFGTAPLAGFVGLELPELNLFSTKAEAVTCGENLTYTFDGQTGSLVISGTGAMWDWKPSSAPWYSLTSLIKTVAIDNGVTSIGNWAFDSCNSLTSIEIPNSVTSIGNGAFSSCDSLTSVEIGNGVTSIGNWAFAYCDSLISISVDVDNPSYSSNEHGALFNKDKTKLIQYPIGNTRTSYSIPNSVTSIGNYAFDSCNSLTSVEIGNSVTSIGNYAFASCYSLTSVEIGNSVTSIGNDAFAFCDSLTIVEIPDSVTSIGDTVFYDCVGLEFIHIPASVTEIGRSAFYGTSAYICAETEDCYAKTYADTKRIEFKLCEGHGSDGHDHVFGEWVTTVEPMCTIDGTKVKYCAKCEEDIKTEAIDALGHDIIIDEAVESTCTETGLTEGHHCLRCDDETIEQEVVPVLGHDIVIDEAVESTCTETGLTEGQHCSRCDGATVEQEAVPALEHDIVIDEAIESTCTETGLTEGQHCSRCDDMTIEREVVPVKPHNYTAKYDSAKHWEECACGSKINVQNHSFVGGNICLCGHKRITNATLSIKNNSGSRTINYGETLKLTANVTNKPYDAKIYWYVDGVLMGEGEIFNINFEGGTKIITVKLVDLNGVVLQNSDDKEICDSENISVNSSLWQKIVSFFKNLFGMNRTVVQTIFKGIY